MSKKRTPGRPPKDPAEKRRNKVFAKLTDSELATANKKATAAELPLSSWVHRTIVRAKK